MSDRVELPFTEAVLLEVQRIATLLPKSAPHRKMKDVSLFGYDIRENSLVTCNIYAVHRDTKLWTDPQHLNQEANFTRRDASGSLEIVNTEYLIPSESGAAYVSANHSRDRNSGYSLLASCNTSKSASTWHTYFRHPLLRRPMPSYVPHFPIK